MLASSSSDGSGVVEVDGFEYEHNQQMEEGNTVSAWGLSDDRKIAEAEALRMWPENLHMGMWDGIIPQAEVERRLLIQRSAYVMGERAAFERRQG